MNLVTIKYNSSGVQQWITSLDGGLSQNDFPASMCISNGGQLEITGYTTNSIFAGYGKSLTVIYNSSGALQWYQIYESSQYPNHVPYDVESDTSGNIYVLGYCRKTNLGLTDIFTLKYNSTGTSRNLNYYGDAPVNEVGRSVNIDNTGNVFVTGSWSSSNPSIHSTILKYSPSDFADKTLNLTTIIQGFYDSTANSMISDTVTVYLRNSSSPYNLVDSAKSVLSSAGNGTFTFKNAMNGEKHYLVITH